MRQKEKAVQGVEREGEMIKERRKKGMGEDTKTKLRLGETRVEVQGIQEVGRNAGRLGEMQGGC